MNTQQLREEYDIVNEPKKQTQISAADPKSLNPGSNPIQPFQIWIQDQDQFFMTKE
jgi:hypothetical protein